MAAKTLIASFLTLLALLGPSRSLAQITLSTPNNTTTAPCADYFSNKWHHGLTMDNASIHGDLLFNILPSEFQDLSGFAYSGGIASMKTTGNFPLARILTSEAPGQIIDRSVTRYGGLAPIDPNEFPILTFKMYSSKNSNYFVRWDKAPNKGAGFTTPQPVKTGWWTYQIDLSTAPTNQDTTAAWTNGNNHGIGIYPAVNTPGTDLQIDWIQLTPKRSSCADVTIDYTAAASAPFSLFLDDDSNPDNGFISRTEPALGTGSSSSHAISSNTLTPGYYYGLGLSSPDYASHFSNPWDMNSLTDLDTGANGPRLAHFTVTSSTNELCGSVNAADPGFHLNQLAEHPVQASMFSKLSFSYKGSSGTVQVLFFGAAGNLIGVLHVPVAQGDSYTTYQLDLSNPPAQAGNSGAWSGTIADIRIDPEVGNGGSFCFDWFSLGSSFTSSQPSAPTYQSSPGSLLISPRYTVSFQQPDIRGGSDYFVEQRGNPANMDSPSDIDKEFNLSKAAIYPGNVYTDSSGAVFQGDYFEGANVQTGTLVDGDPAIGVVLRDFARPIDANRYKIVCSTLDIHTESIFKFHSVLRYSWEVDLAGDGSLKGYTSDDIVLKTTGDEEYCVELENLPIEERDAVTIFGNFWQNGKSPGIPSFGIHPHEEDLLEPFRIGSVRLATHHEADSKYAIVLTGSRSQPVQLFKNTTRSTSGGTLIGSLNANRNSDVYVWNTTNEPNGTKYHLYATVNGTSFLADAPVVINHSTYSDTTPPTLKVDAPASDRSGRYDALNIAGDVVDNVRVATVEVFLDGNLFHTLMPNLFNIDARTSHPNVPDTDQSGFNVSLSLANVSNGPHTVVIDAHDTAGNKTSYSTSFTRATTNLTAPISFPIANEPKQDISLAEPPVVGANINLEWSVNGSGLNYTVSGLTNPGNKNNCSRVRLKLASNRNALTAGGFTSIFESTSASDLADGSVAYTSASVPRIVVNKPKLKACTKKNKKKGQKVDCEAQFKAYIQADCGDGTQTSAISTITASKVGNPQTKVKTIAQWIDRVRQSGTPL